MLKEVSSKLRPDMHYLPHAEARAATVAAAAYFIVSAVYTLFCKISAISSDLPCGLYLEELLQVLL